MALADRINSLDALQIGRRIDAERLVIGLDDPDFETVLDGPELFQPFRRFERTDGQFGIFQQEIAPVYIKTDVFVYGPGRYEGSSRARNRLRSRNDRSPL